MENHTAGWWFKAKLVSSSKTFDQIQSKHLAQFYEGVGCRAAPAVIDTPCLKTRQAQCSGLLWTFLSRSSCFWSLLALSWAILHCSLAWSLSMISACWDARACANCSLMQARERQRERWRERERVREREREREHHHKGHHTPTLGNLMADSMWECWS